jgi:hypothetical protein
VRTRNGRHVPHTTARFCCLRCRRCCRGDDGADGGGLALFGCVFCVLLLLGCFLTFFLYLSVETHVVTRTKVAPYGWKATA